MKKKEINFVLIQITIWVVVYLLMLLYSIRDREGILRGWLLSTNNLATCLLTIYSQSHFLLPRYLHKGTLSRYLAMTSITVILLVLVRAMSEYVLIYHYLGIVHFYNLSISHFAFVFLAVFLCSVIGFLLRISLDYVALLKHTETLKHQQLLSELNFLKSQVQPHFLFNTLNNIYSLANKKSERTAEVVAMLSDMMRYFVHEASKERVLLSHELNLIRNYIELERIRMHHPLVMDWVQETTEKDVRIPPMLFMPFIENFFKHGVDKSRADNCAHVRFIQDNAAIHFTMKNKVWKTDTDTEKGVGLDNVKRRLEILYGEAFTLSAGERDGLFEVDLKIPLTA